MSHEPPMAEELDEMDLRAAAATEGPWVPLLETRRGTGGSSAIQVAPETSPVENEMHLRHYIDNKELLSPNVQVDANLDFIAAAREDVPRLPESRSGTVGGRS